MEDILFARIPRGKVKQKEAGDGFDCPTAIVAANSSRCLDVLQHEGTESHTVIDARQAVEEQTERLGLFAVAAADTGKYNVDQRDGEEWRSCLLSSMVEDTDNRHRLLRWLDESRES